MGRLTTEKDVKEMSMYELAHNSCYTKDRMVRLSEDDLCNQRRSRRQAEGVGRRIIMSMTGWAEREVKIACEREHKASNMTEGEWDYGCACYESALKAFKSLAEDGHSGMSFGFTKNILIRLMEHKPLTPIEDTEENWNSLREYGDTKKYQCVRMSSLFKEINDDGTITYSDVERVACIDINNGYSYSSGLVCGIIDEMFPITMPYDPPVGYIKVYCEDFLTDPKNGDYDTQGIFYAIMPDGERVEINKFYGENGRGFVKISKEEYEKRKARRVRR